MRLSQISFSDRVRPKAAAHLIQFSDEARKHFPERIKKVILFGSRARGDATRRSDYDVAVVMDSINDPRLVDHQLSDIAYPHILAGVHIRPVAVLASTLERYEDTPFTFNLAREGLEVARAAR